jgi:hypothetical protein
MRRSTLAKAALAAVTMVISISTAATSSASAAPTAGPGANVAARPATHVSQAQAVSVRAQLRAGTLARTHGAVSLCANGKLACRLMGVTASKTSTSLLASDYYELGYGAEDLQTVYGLTTQKDGAGTVALVETGTYPSLASDLAIYRSFNNLPDCSVASGCLKIVDKNGKPKLEALPTDFEGLYGEEVVAEETALDVDMVSAACPACHILVVALPLKDAYYPQSTAAANAQFRDFGTGVGTAVRLGARGVSLSYGLPASTYSDTTAAAAFRRPGVAVVASSGDNGANGDEPIWPQNLATVISAGGTSLYPSGTGFAQTAWTGAGSSCSTDVGPAVGQPDSVSSACDGHRAASDLSAVADPFTGVSVYDSFSPYFGVPDGFTVFGGTSVAAPFLAAMNVRAGVTASTIGPNQLYAAPKGSITDVTIGANASPGLCPEYDVRNCYAGPGWDGPTGLGTPKGLVAFR